MCSCFARCCQAASRQPWKAADSLLFNNRFMHVLAFSALAFFLVTTSSHCLKAAACVLFRKCCRALEMESRLCWAYCTCSCQACHALNKVALLQKASAFVTCWRVCLRSSTKLHQASNASAKERWLKRAAQQRCLASGQKKLTCTALAISQAYTSAHAHNNAVLCPWGMALRLYTITTITDHSVVQPGQ